MPLIYQGPQAGQPGGPQDAPNCVAVGGQGRCAVLGPKSAEVAPRSASVGPIPGVSRWPQECCGGPQVCVWWLAATRSAVPGGGGGMTASVSWFCNFCVS